MGLSVRFYQIKAGEDPEPAYVVIASRHRQKWIVVRHKERTTWEIPGGHREPAEDARQAACRELYEETGALQYELRPVYGYMVADGLAVSHGMLYFAEVRSLGRLPASEIGEIRLVDDPLQLELTYPRIQPLLHRKILEYIGRNEPR